jgi:hypothetical protein
MRSQFRDFQQPIGLFFATGRNTEGAGNDGIKFRTEFNWLRCRSSEFSNADVARPTSQPLPPRMFFTIIGYVL